MIGVQGFQVNGCGLWIGLNPSTCVFRNDSVQSDECHFWNWKKSLYPTLLSMGMKPFWVLRGWIPHSAPPAASSTFVEYKTLDTIHRCLSSHFFPPRAMHLGYWVSVCTVASCPVWLRSSRETLTLHDFILFQSMSSSASSAKCWREGLWIPPFCDITVCAFALGSGQKELNDGSLLCPAKLAMLGHLPVALYW